MATIIDPDSIIAMTKEYDQQYYATTTIVLGELYEDGLIDFTADEWKFPQYSDEQHERLCNLIIDHYYERDICCVPLKNWRRQFTRKMREIMPKYIQLYKALDENDGQISASSEWYKSRNIVSDFPQTQLSGNEDYASMGTDHQYERLHSMSALDLADALRNYDDVDYMIIKEIEPLFSCLMTVSVNAW